MPTTPTIIKTEDGSHSLYIKELNEHYHSVHGAIQESKHVFIDAGLNYFIANKTTPLKISILEIGMGTGLNIFLTYLENTTTLIDYTTIEAYPLHTNIVAELNYIQELKASKHHSVFETIHNSTWNEQIQIDTNFTLKKINNTLQSTLFEKEQFDIIYFDAFSPTSQPEMWTENIFKKIIEATKPNGILVTYCAKGEVKRILKKVGFTVDSIKGPPGKREMIRATKK